MGRAETEIITDEIVQFQAAEREMNALRAQLAERDNALKEAQVRLEQEIAQRDRLIAALEETQRQLIDAHEAALKGSRAKSEFLSNMSNEIP